MEKLQNVNHKNVTNHQSYNNQSEISNDTFSFLKPESKTMNGLTRDLLWFSSFIKYSVSLILPNVSTQEIEPLPELDYSCAYDMFLSKNNITNDERIILLLSLTPHFMPGMLNTFTLGRRDHIPVAEFGGVLVGDSKNFFPTIETALFLLSDSTLDSRTVNEKYFLPTSKLCSNNWILHEQIDAHLPSSFSMIVPSFELLALIKGEQFRPDFDSKFPASYITTKLDWLDLVLPYDTMDELDDIKVWLQHGVSLLNHKELSKKIKPGFRALFYGPPGTGKTLTASLLGKEFGLDVYRIDLSMLVSKWVGETEKNLKHVFDQAANKNWILFFDEADSIFGKRTQTSSSNDRYANQEVSYLLQRIEDFPGIVILASNLKSNIDEAFNRRFQSIVYFPMPDSEIRFQLWQKAFPSDFVLDHSINLQIIADKYEMPGGSIINVVRFCALKALQRNTMKITLDDIELGIIKEFKKKGKIVA